MPEPTPVATVAPTPDPLPCSFLPTASPALSVLQEMLPDGAKSFKLSHEPMACPPLPPAPPKVRAGKRAHSIATLTHLVAYIDHLKLAEMAKTAVEVNAEVDSGANVGGLDPIAFYSDAGVSCVLSEKSPHEKEVITCTLDRHPDFKVWQALLGQKLSQPQFVGFLRTCNRSIFGSDQASYLIGSYASLTGTLAHGADDYLDMQSQSATFTVKRKQRGQAAPVDTEVTDVPTQFSVSFKILADDQQATMFNVLVRMTGDAGAQVQFTLSIENFASIVAEHLDARLKQFAASAGFTCLRGEYQEEEWEEPQMPGAVLKLMEAQTSMIAALKKTV